MLDVGVNKSLPATPSIVVNSLSTHERGLSDEKAAPRTRSKSLLSASSASSVVRSSRGVSAATRGVDLSVTEVRALEARVQQMA